MKLSRTFFCFMALLTATVFISCGKDEEVSDTSNSTTSVPDPEGTVLVSMRNESNERTLVDLFPESGYSPSLYIDKGNNFNCTGTMSFCVIGEVAGLGNIRSVPEQGWASKVSVLPGYGYVARVYSYSSGDYFYARLYVIEYIVNTSKEILGARIKYQTPFFPDNISYSDSIK